MHENHWPVSHIRGYQVNEVVPTCLCYLFLMVACEWFCSHVTMNNFTTVISM